MPVVHTPGESLLITENPRLARLAMSVAAVSVAYGAFAGPAVLADGNPLTRFLAVLGALAFLMAAARLESLHYRFDVRSRVLHWQRAHLYRRSEGNIPFDAIEGVQLRAVVERESPMTPQTSYQPMLRTSAGDFPLSLHTSHANGDFSALLDMVRATLGVAEQGKAAGQRAPNDVSP